MLAHQLTLATVIRANALTNAHRVALIDDEITITHAELDRRTNRLARRMQAEGIVAGDRIAILLPDGIRLAEILIAASKIGAISILLNWRLAAPEIAWIIADGAPKAIFHSEPFASLLPDDPRATRHAVAGDPLADRQYLRWTAEGPDAAPANLVANTSPLFIMYTSGTTGRPKGCVQSHESTIAHALAMAARRGLNRDDRNLSVNPLFHVAGLGHLITMFAIGGATVFAPQGAGPAGPLEAAAAHSCTIATLGQPLIAARQHVDAALLARLRLRTVTGGSGLVAPEAFAFVQDEWNALLVGGYGQTESNSFSLLIDYPDMLEHPTALGWPMPHVDIRLLDASGHPIPELEAEGEIGLRGPSVTLGYWNNPEATEEALGTGWLRSGDLARRDALGLFHMLGRTKELIKSGGENVYPAEVEPILRALPGVADAAIAGVRDARWGEAVKAFIVLEDGHDLPLTAIAQACRARIAGYKRPRYLEFIDRIPRDYMGKIRRYQLSERPVTPEQALD